MAIYFIQAGEKGPIKVGYAVSPEGRLHTLQIGNHEKLYLLLTLPSDKEMEKKIHSDLKKFKIKGEWFKVTSDVLKYIDDIKYVDYEVQGGRAYAVLWREREGSKSVPCPFCGKGHTHGIGEGHRVTHCINPVNQVEASDGTVLFRDNGYIVRNKERYEFKTTAIIPQQQDLEDLNGS